MNGLQKVLEIIRTLFARNVKSSSVDLEKKIVMENMTSKGKILFKDNSTRLTNEFTTLLDKNKELHDIITDLCEYCYTFFKKDIVLTMIYRTDEEQDSIYKDDPKYKIKKFKSPHQFWQAFDLRSSTFTPEEIKFIEDYLNNKYNSVNFYKWTARNHTVGLGFHFHIQYTKK